MTGCPGWSLLSLRATSGAPLAMMIALAGASKLVEGRRGVGSA
jgi:hypothetical protein